MKAKKHLGQNFLHNQHTLQKIVEASQIESHDTVVEVGPGKGALTEKLLEKASKLICIEKDNDLIPLLESKFSKNPAFELVEGDILTQQMPQIDYKVVANIPYYITSPILNYFLQTQHRPKTLTLLVQKEVAEKICAMEGDHSILSIQVQLFGSPKILFKVPKTHFTPVPKVDSAVIFIEVYEEDKYKHPQEILRIAKISFSQKRKKLRNTLGKQFKVNIQELEQKSGISLEKRPEDLSLKEWESLYEALNSLL